MRTLTAAELSAFAHGVAACGGTAELADIVIDTTSKELAAEVGGVNTPVMDLQLGPARRSRPTSPSSSPLRAPRRSAWTASSPV